MQPPRIPGFSSGGDAGDDDDIQIVGLDGEEGEEHYSPWPPRRDGGGDGEGEEELKAEPK